MGQPGLLYREILCQKKKIKKPFYKMFVLDFHSRVKISIIKRKHLFGFMVSEVSIRGWSSQLLWPFWELEENTVKQTGQQRVGEGAERPQPLTPTEGLVCSCGTREWLCCCVIIIWNKGREYRPVVELCSSTNTAWLQSPTPQKYVTMLRKRPGIKFVRLWKKTFHSLIQ